MIRSGSKREHLGGRRSWPGGIGTLAAALICAWPAHAGAADHFAVGDSITRQSSHEIQTRFTQEGWSASVRAFDSQRIDQMRDDIQEIARNTPSLKRMFIFLGTNDAWKYQNDKQWKLQWSFNELHAAVHDVTDIRPKACIYLTTIKIRPDPAFSFPRYDYAAWHLNQHMSQIADSSSKVHLIDWAKFTIPHDGDPGEDDWFADFIGHLTPIGQWHLADRFRNWGRVTSGCGTTLP